MDVGGGGDALDAPNDDIFNLPTIVNNEVDNMFEELLMGDDGGATTTTDPVGGMGMMGTGGGVANRFVCAERRVVFAPGV